MKLISDHPWYFTLLCVMAGFLFSFALYYKDKKNADRKKGLLYLLFSLRWMSMSIIFLLLMDFVMKQLINETEKPVIVFVQDNSSSMTALKDSDQIRGEYSQRIHNMLSRLKNQYEVNTYWFDSQMKSGDQYDFSGKETDLSVVFKDIENNYANRNIGAVILASDGIYNKGTNPLYSSSKFTYPIYTIALGDTTPLKDIWIQNVRHNQVAYLGNSFPVEVVVNANDLKGKMVNLTIRQQAQILQDKSISITSDHFSETFNFILEAKATGLQKYTVTISTLSEDHNLSNNTQSFMLEVIDNREKILILENAPHPDVSAIYQSIMANQSYEAEVAGIQDFQKPLKPYSLVILHQLTPGPQSQKIINELKNNNQPYWVIGISSFDFVPGMSVRTMSSKWNDAEAVIKKNFSLFNVSDELKSFVKEFPAIKCAMANYEVANSYSTLISQQIGVVETENPILLFGEYNQVKRAAFLGDGLWRWKMRDYAEHQNNQLFNELISKTVQYLAVKADKSFFRVYTKKVINENEAIDFTAEVYNQSYELITEPDVNLVLKDSNGKKYQYTFSKRSNSYVLNAGTFPAGEYMYEAQTKVGDQVFVKSGMIMIKEIVAEKLNTVADHQLLYQLSTQSSGKMYLPNQTDELVKDIENSTVIKPITYSHKSTTDILNLKWIALLVILLLGIEWFFRKYNGSI